MRGVKRYSWLLVLAMMTAASIVQADSRIAFSSDRFGEGDEWDLWKMKDDGTNQIAVTELQFEAHNPSIGQNGSKIFFDYEDGKIYMGDFTDVEETPVALFDGWDPDSMTLISLGGGRERLLWTDDYNGRQQIWMGVLDVEDKLLEEAAILMTDPIETADRIQAEF